MHKIFRLIAEKDDTEIVENKYKSGGYGYGHAKMDLFGLILDKYKYQREKYSYLMSNKNEIDKVLSKGASKALDTASDVLKRVKTKLGY